MVDAASGLPNSAERRSGSEAGLGALFAVVLPSSARFRGVVEVRT